MLRINLLPSSVAQRRLSKRLTAAFTVLLILCVALPLLYSAKLAHDSGSEAAGRRTPRWRPRRSPIPWKRRPSQHHRADPADPGQSRFRGRGPQAPHGPDAHLLHAGAVHRLQVIYSDATYSGSTMTVHAYAPSIAEVGRYLQRMYHNIQVRSPDPNTVVFKDIAIDHVPGYRGLRQQVLPGQHPGRGRQPPRREPAPTRHRVRTPTPAAPAVRRQ